MAVTAGKKGKVTIGANVIDEIGEWAFDEGMDMLEKTKFQQDEKTFAAGLYDATGSFSGRHDMSDTNGQVALRTAMKAGTELTLNLYTDDTHYYSGPALIKSRAVKSSTSTLVEVEYQFQGNGEWDFT